MSLRPAATATAAAAAGTAAKRDADASDVVAKLFSNLDLALDTDAPKRKVAYGENDWKRLNPWDDNLEQRWRDVEEEEYYQQRRERATRRPDPYDRGYVQNMYEPPPKSDDAAPEDLAKLDEMLSEQPGMSEEQKQMVLAYIQSLRPTPAPKPTPAPASAPTPKPPPRTPNYDNARRILDDAEKQEEAAKKSMRERLAERIGMR
jgi:hypothetical protein